MFRGAWERKAALYLGLMELQGCINDSFAFLAKRKTVRAVKENMARMCSANWKCILF